MMPSCPCKSTQKMLSDDTHIVLLPKILVILNKQCQIFMSYPLIRTVGKMLSGDTDITFLCQACHKQCQNMCGNFLPNGESARQNNESIYEIAWDPQ